MQSCVETTSHVVLMVFLFVWQSIELSLELSEPALECTTLPSKALTAELNLRDPSRLQLCVDQDKFFSLYEDLIQAHALLQSIKR